MRDVYNHLRYIGLFFNEYEFDDIDDGPTLVKIKPLDNKEIFNFIDDKIEKYKKINTFDLVDKAHQTSPWLNARKGIPENAISRKKIKYSDLEKFVKSWEPF